MAVAPADWHGARLGKPGKGPAAGDPFSAYDVTAPLPETVVSTTVCSRTTVGMLWGFRHRIRPHFGKALQDAGAAQKAVAANV